MYKIIFMILLVLTSCSQKGSEGGSKLVSGGGGAPVPAPTESSGNNNPAPPPPGVVASEITSPANNSIINLAANSSTYSVAGTCSEEGQTLQILIDSNQAISPIGFVCTSGNFSGTIDVTGVAEGAHTMQSSQLDGDLNPVLSNALNISKDSVAPTISLSTPANNSFITSLTNSAVFPVNGTCSENASVVNIQVNGSDASNQSGFICDGTNFNGTIDTTSLPDGVLNFTASIADAAGNQTTTVDNVVSKDAVAATVSISNPVDNSYINLANNSATFAIMGSCNKNGQVISLLLNSNPAANPVGFTCDGTNFTGTIDTNGVAEGAIQLKAQIQDQANNIFESSIVNLVKDVTAPSIAITTPADASYITTVNDSTTFAVNGTCSENTRPITIQINGGNASGQTGMICDGTNFSGTINTTSLPSGSLNFTAIISDQAGNQTTSSTNNVTKDAVAPTVSISNPVDNSYINLGNNSATFAIMGSCNKIGQVISIILNTIQPLVQLVLLATEQTLPGPLIPLELLKVPFN